MSRPVIPLSLGALAAALIALALISSAGSGTQDARAAAPAQTLTTAFAPLAQAHAARPERTQAVARTAASTRRAEAAALAALLVAPKPRPARRPGIARLAVLRGTLTLRTRPGGPVAAKLSARTEFGSTRVLAVAAQRGRWLGVTSTARPNGRLAWVDRRDPALRLRRTGWSLHADLSQRRLELRRFGRTVQRVSVAIGRPGSPTPTGRFAVTDKLDGRRYGPYYGCCILALNATQQHLPSGWTGGNRIAIHGTDSPGTIGTPASAGCLRAGDADLERLMRRVPLGTPVIVRS